MKGKSAANILPLSDGVILLAAICIGNSIASASQSAHTRPILSIDDLRYLHDFGLNRLQDFVRGKGRGSVSRVPYNFDIEDKTESSQSELKLGEKDDDEVVDLGEQFKMIVPNIPFVISQPDIVNSSSTAASKMDKHESEKRITQRPFKGKERQSKEPTDRDYERLAEILQEIIRHRRPTTEIVESTDNTRNNINTAHLIVIDDSSKKHRSLIKNQLVEFNGSHKQGTTTFTTPKDAQPQEFSTESAIENSEEEDASLNSFGVTDADLKRGSMTTTAVITSIKGVTESVNDRQGDDVQWKIREIGRELNTVLSRLKNGLYKDNSTLGSVTSFPRNDKSAASRQMSAEFKPMSKAYVTILREGIARQKNSDQYAFVASITLIRDSGKIILVDTGLATDINGRTDLIRKLGKLNIAPPAVDYVVTTHGHADHAGNTNDFPDAVHFQGVVSHHRTIFNFSDLFEKDRHQITPHVFLLKTPGHSAEDITVIVHNTDKYGTMAVVGDVFISEEDFDYPMMWKPLAWNDKVQEQSRRKLLCLADYIVPGHGKVFHVSSSLRDRVKCH